MKIRLEFYGVLRGLMGCKNSTIDIVDGSTVKMAIDQLVQCSKPKVGQYIRPASGGYAVRFSLNGRIVQEDYSLCPDDTIKLLVPMSGG